MNNARTERFYCHDAYCKGSAGFDVPFSQATEYSPPEAYLDYCPECDGDIHPDPLPYDDLEDLVERSYYYHAPRNVNFDDLSNAIVKELQRQAREEIETDINNGIEWIFSTTPNAKAWRDL